MSKFTKPIHISANGNDYYINLRIPILSDTKGLAFKRRNEKSLNFISTIETLIKITLVIPIHANYDFMTPNVCKCEICHKCSVEKYLCRYNCKS